MYVIVAYDVAVERVNKVKSYLRTQLTWVQNSLFEGEITESRFLEIQKSLLDLIDPEHDCVTIYKFSDAKLFERKELGVKKGDPNAFVI
jgi:CRISPR-associated protein Cas2